MSVLSNRRLSWDADKAEFELSSSFSLFPVDIEDNYRRSEKIFSLYSVEVQPRSKLAARRYDTFFDFPVDYRIFYKGVYGL